MPYHSISDLPDRVKDNLPKHAQEIYKEAFNNAYKTHKDDTNTGGETNAEEIAHRIAWSAVKNSYHKNEKGNWIASD